MFFAVAENRFNDISDLMKRTNVCLNAKDWLEKDEKGISLLDHAAGVDALGSVFQKHCWKSAQDLQTVWNAVPDARKNNWNTPKNRFPSDGSKTPSCTIWCFIPFKNRQRTVKD